MSDWTLIQQWPTRIYERAGFRVSHVFQPVTGRGMWQLRFPHGTAHPFLFDSKAAAFAFAQAGEGVAA